MSTQKIREERGSATRIWDGPLRDIQQEGPAAWCRRCRGEIYRVEAEADGAICPDCRREKQETGRSNRQNMTLMELSKEYRNSAQVLAQRIGELNTARQDIADGIERICMDERIKLLETMWREARDLAVLTERYYERGYRRNAKYTL